MDYFKRLEEYYEDYPDQASISALADIKGMQERARELKIYREMDKTKELIAVAINRYKICIDKLTNPDVASKMTDYERANCFAAMDWCMYTLDVIGENPEMLSKQANEMVEGYARKVGFIHN